jgi:hypothetical protein
MPRPRLPKRRRQSHSSHFHLINRRVAVRNGEVIDTPLEKVFMPPRRPAYALGGVKRHRQRNANEDELFNLLNEYSDNQGDLRLRDKEDWTRIKEDFEEFNVRVTAKRRLSRVPAYPEVPPRWAPEYIGLTLRGHGMGPQRHPVGPFSRQASPSFIDEEGGKLHPVVLFQADFGR